MARVIQLSCLRLQLAYLEDSFLVQRRVRELFDCPLKQSEPLRCVAQLLHEQEPREVTERSHRFVFGVIVQD